MRFQKDWYDSRLFSCRFIIGGDPLEGRSGAPEIATLFQTCLCGSFHRSGVNRLRARSTGCIAATELVWTVVILNGSEASGPWPLARAFIVKCIASSRCIKSFGGQGDWSEPPRTPPAYGPDCQYSSLGFHQHHPFHAR